QANPVIKGVYDYQTCTETDGRCIPFNEDFVFDQIKVVGSVAAPAPKPTGSVTPVKEKTVAKPLVNQDSLKAAAAPPDNAVAKTAEAETSKDSVDIAMAQGEKTDPTTPETIAETTTEPETAGSLWSFFLIAFGSGLVALLTPCVFPMVPMTVSFFTGNSGSRAGAILKALVYGFSIIAIYTIIGTLVSRIFGGDAA